MNFLIKIGLGIPLIIGGFVAADAYAIMWVGCFIAGICITKPVKGVGKSGISLGLSISPLLLIPGLFHNPEVAISVGGYSPLGHSS